MVQKLDGWIFEWAIHPIRDSQLFSKNFLCCDLFLSLEHTLSLLFSYPIKCFAFLRNKAIAIANLPFCHIFFFDSCNLPLFLMSQTSSAALAVGVQMYKKLHRLPTLALIPLYHIHIFLFEERQEDLKTCG